jgi:hypothetical protein
MGKNATFHLRWAEIQIAILWVSFIWFTQVKSWETVPFMLFYISQVASAIISIIHTLFIIIVVKQSLTCSWGILFTSVKDVYIVQDIYIYVLASVNNSYETIVLVGLQNHPVHTLMTSLVKIGCEDELKFKLQFYEFHSFGVSSWIL